MLLGRLSNGTTAHSSYFPLTINRRRGIVQVSVIEHDSLPQTDVIGNLLYHCTIDQSTTMITATASSKKIGGDWNVWDPKAKHVTSFCVNSERAYLTVDQTKNALGTANVNTGKPYRFVFLDGCETAGGNFPQAFCGKVLHNKETDETFFGDPQNGWYARPRAFVGWKKGKEPVWGGRAPTLGVCEGYIKFRQELFRQWNMDLTLRDALREAANAVKDPGVDDDYTWRDPLHPEKRIVWDDGLLLYGDRDLKIEQFNPSPMPQ